MLVVSRANESFHDEVFANIPSYIRPGDCLVLNNTRVFPARLHGHRNSKSGAHYMFEVTLLIVLSYISESDESVKYYTESVVLLVLECDMPW